MGRKFTLFHLAFVERGQLAFDTFRGTREEWLRHALAEGFEFDHRAGERLHWVHIDSTKEVVFGLLQRIRRHERHRSPKEGDKGDALIRRIAESPRALKRAARDG